MIPDWSQAPEGARFFNANTGMWYRRKFYEVQVWRDGSWKYTHHPTNPSPLYRETRR